MRKLLLLFCLFLIAFCRESFALPFPSDSVAERQPYRNSIYVELLGNARLGSLNYERLFRTNADPVVATRIGGLIFPVEKRGFLMIVPTEISFINGKHDLKFEYGFGLTYVKFFENEGPYDGTEWETINTWLPVFRLGARYQPAGKPYFMRLAFTPNFVGDAETGPSPFLPWGGLSFGYSFGRK